MQWPLRNYMLLYKCHSKFSFEWNKNFIEIQLIFIFCHLTMSNIVQQCGAQVNYGKIKQMMNLDESWKVKQWMNMFKKRDTGRTLGMGRIGWTKGKWNDGWTHVNWMTNEPMGSWSTNEHDKCVSYPFLWVSTTIFVTLLHSWPFH